eukprot:bmy_21696T0
MKNTLPGRGTPKAKAGVGKASAGKGGLLRLPAPALVFWETASDTSGARISWRFTAGTGVSPLKAAKNSEGLKRPGTMQRRPSGSTAVILPVCSTLIRRQIQVLEKPALHRSCLPLTHPHARLLLPGNPVITELLHTFMFPRKIHSTENKYSIFEHFKESINVSML